MANKHISVRVDPETLEKFRVVAKSEGRSLNNYILMMIHKSIAKYEDQHGPIQLKS